MPMLGHLVAVHVAEGLAAERDASPAAGVYTPLMQLSMELLPAPLGPMMARISCSRTSKRDVGQRLHAAKAQARCS